jgi:hypothetical protein
LKVDQEVLEKIEAKFDLLNEIFLNYSKYGDKLNFNKMNYVGFHNFLKDNDLIHGLKREGSSGMLSSRTFKSPKMTSNRSCNSSPKKVVNTNLIKGKLVDSEAYCIFCSLTGSKNFDNSSKYKNHFDKNKGFSPIMGESGRSTNLNSGSSLQSSKINIPMRMDFNLFVKSLELVSTKLHPEKSLDEAMTLFLENV